MKTVPSNFSLCRSAPMKRIKSFAAMSMRSIQSLTGRSSVDAPRETKVPSNLASLEAVADVTTNLASSTTSWPTITGSSRASPTSGSASLSSSSTTPPMPSSLNVLPTQLAAKASIKPLRYTSAIPPHTMITQTQEKSNFYMCVTRFSEYRFDHRYL
ncbi:unnamed protein product [Protopolystoma xenopodis]|uniref:Uncharacterized protein n=1 Tax=Protopolystoma xenopodis TaxID=117903 RepID=A0A3S5FFQ4_9PLAT|nr:unnamed protein product [Protopolystoma xenopodis]